VFQGTRIAVLLVLPNAISMLMLLYNAMCVCANPTRIHAKENYDFVLVSASETLFTNPLILGQSSGMRKGFEMASSMPDASDCSICSMRAFALTARIGRRKDCFSARSWEAEEADKVFLC
jgi:hypothetical protein